MTLLTCHYAESTKRLLRLSWMSLCTSQTAPTLRNSCFTWRIFCSGFWLSSWQRLLLTCSFAFFSLFILHVQRRRTLPWWALEDHKFSWGLIRVHILRGNVVFLPVVYSRVKPVGNESLPAVYSITVGSWSLRSSLLHHTQSSLGMFVRIRFLRAKQHSPLSKY